MKKSCKEKFLHSTLWSDPFLTLSLSFRRQNHFKCNWSVKLFYVYSLWAFGCLAYVSPLYLRISRAFHVLPFHTTGKLTLSISWPVLLIRYKVRISANNQIVCYHQKLWTLWVYVVRCRAWTTKALQGILHCQTKITSDKHFQRRKNSLAISMM